MRTQTIALHSFQRQEGERIIGLTAQIGIKIGQQIRDDLQTHPVQHYILDFKGVVWISAGFFMNLLEAVCRERTVTEVASILQPEGLSDADQALWDYTLDQIQFRESLSEEAFERFYTETENEGLAVSNPDFQPLKRPIYLKTHYSSYAINFPK
jgi:hypothetical protein